ncbi:MAG: formyltransferase family protein [Rickettsiales bacterium]
MKITLFTSNQPRHYSLIKDLASIASEVYVIQECMTLFPGQIPDFYAKSDIMQTYFKRVIDAEHEVFGSVDFIPSNVRTLALKTGDLNFVPMETLAPALNSDFYAVFGGSFIKSPLIDALIERNTVNLHMGMSPYYRGAACNFWALHDGNADLVGATIHKLSRGLDNGDMLFHALPKREATDPFVLGMRAVRAAHKGLLEALESKKIFDYEPVPQDKSQEIRYTRNREFTDEIASEYLQRNLTEQDVVRMFEQAPERNLIRPYYD